MSCTINTVSKNVRLIMRNNKTKITASEIFEKYLRNIIFRKQDVGITGWKNKQRIFQIASKE